MKTILTILLILSAITVNSQVIYSWTNGVDPGWTSSDPSQNTLDWQTNYGAVSTSDTYGPFSYLYNNDQITTYISPNYDMTCPNASMIHIEMDLYINLENNWDYLYFDYSYDGGNTWINEDSWTGQDFGINRTYNISESTSIMFRFRFESDYIINSSSLWGVYYADILDFTVECITYLPVELRSFEVEPDGTRVEISWSTLSEKNNSHFIVERSFDGKVWERVKTINGQGNTTLKTEYEVYDKLHQGVTYYRLTQYDFDGVSEELGIKSVVGELNTNIVKTVNLLGQTVDDSYRGVVIDIFSDNSTRKRYQ